MTVKVKLADGTVEVFDTDKYKISKVKDFHPAICSVTVYHNGNVIFHRKRLFSILYKIITFKSKKVQDMLSSLNNQQQQQEEK